MLGSSWPQRSPANTKLSRLKLIYFVTIYLPRSCLNITSEEKNGHGGCRRLIKHDAIRAREGMVEQLHAFITQVLEEGEWLSSRPGHFIQKQWALSISGQEGAWSPIDSVDVLVKQKNPLKNTCLSCHYCRYLTVLPTAEPGCSVVQTTACGWRSFEWVQTVYCEVSVSYEPCSMQ